MKEGGAAQSTVRTEEQAGEPSVVRSGKWKIPSSTDYLDLFKGLLDCENMKVTTFYFAICLFHLFNHFRLAPQGLHSVSTVCVQVSPFLQWKIVTTPRRIIHCTKTREQKRSLKKKKKPG